MRTGKAFGRTPPSSAPENLYEHMIHSTPALSRASLRPRPQRLSWENIRLAIICLDREELREWLTRHTRRAPRA